MQSMKIGREERKERGMSEALIVFPRRCSICDAEKAEHLIDANGFSAMDEVMCEYCYQAFQQIQANTLAKQNRQMRLSKLRIVQ
uniref:Uncharacterized protein n=4 Tax=Acinetobacter baumannii TaxID=470 RepID=A0A482F3M2_ACIBA|nr:hypothetical protein [Acinetobacter baumannii]